MELVANKFNAETDEDRPQINSEFVYEGETCVVKNVDHVLLSDIIGGKPEPEKGEYDIQVFKPHTTRPAVYWVVRANKK